MDESKGHGSQYIGELSRADIVRFIYLYMNIKQQTSQSREQKGRALGGGRTWKGAVGLLLTKPVNFCHVSWTRTAVDVQYHILWAVCGLQLTILVLNMENFVQRLCLMPNVLIKMKDTGADHPSTELLNWCLVKSTWSALGSHFPGSPYTLSWTLSPLPRTICCSQHTMHRTVLNSRVSQGLSTPDFWETVYFGFRRFLDQPLNEQRSKSKTTGINFLSQKSLIHKVQELGCCDIDTVVLLRVSSQRFCTGFWCQLSSLYMIVLACCRNLVETSAQFSLNKALKYPISYHQGLLCGWLSNHALGYLASLVPTYLHLCPGGIHCGKEPLETRTN